MANFHLEKEILSVLSSSNKELKAHEILRNLKSKIAPRTLNSSLKYLKDIDRIVSIDQKSWKN
jgi:Fe2+ or Zn2+ uptake regulation protein